MDQQTLPMPPPNMPEVGWLTLTVWCACGLIGTGIKTAMDIGAGKVLNKWEIAAALMAGPTMAGGFTQLVVSMLGVEYAGAAAGIAVLIGFMAIGFLRQLRDGKIGIINKFMGGDTDGKNP